MSRPLHNRFHLRISIMGLGGRIYVFHFYMGQTTVRDLKTKIMYFLRNVFGLTGRENLTLIYNNAILRDWEIVASFYDPQGNDPVLVYIH